MCRCLGFRCLRICSLIQIYRLLCLQTSRPIEPEGRLGTYVKLPTVNRGEFSLKASTQLRIRALFSLYLSISLYRFLSSSYKRSMLSAPNCGLCLRACVYPANIAVHRATGMNIIVERGVREHCK